MGWTQAERYLVYRPVNIYLIKLTAETWQKPILPCNLQFDKARLKPLMQV